MKIAIIDSGVHADHPHVGGIAGGIAIVGDDLVDRLGHGTAIAGAVREKVPQAEIYAVKVFDRRLSTTIENIVRALQWCVENEMDVINLSVGTKKPVGQVPHLPLVVTLPDVIASAIPVLPDGNCPRDRFYHRDGIFYASPYPRPIPGISPQRNLNGASFAIANMTGFVARALAELPDFFSCRTTNAGGDTQEMRCPPASVRQAIRSALIAKAANNP